MLQMTSQNSEHKLQDEELNRAQTSDAAESQQVASRSSHNVLLFEPSASSQIARLSASDACRRMSASNHDDSNATDSTS